MVASTGIPDVSKINFKPSQVKKIMIYATFPFYINITPMKTEYQLRFYQQV